MDNFEFFGLNLGKLPYYVWCFGSNIVEGVAESWVETEISWEEVDGAGLRLKWAGWRWMGLGVRFSNALLEVVLHAGLNIYRESSGGSQFVTHSLFVWYKWLQTRSTSCTNLIFPLSNLYQSVPIRIQNNMHSWWIEIKKSSKYKLNDKIGDLSKTTFWYHSNDTKRNPWVMLCSHCPINDSSGLYTLPFTLQLC